MKPIFQTYHDHMDSGFEHLENIPSFWKLARLKISLAKYDNGVWGGEPKGQNDTTCIRVADFNRQKLTINVKNNTVRYIEKPEYLVKKLYFDNLLLEKSGGGENQLVGQVVSFNHNIPAVCSNFIMRLKVSTDFNSRFIAFYNAFLYAVKINYKHIKQTTGIQNLDVSSYFNEYIAYPDYMTQTKIANFLDEKTKGIDQAITKKQQLIELLKEQKAILMNQAVTKGLNPNVPMKDSGVEWVGEIPEHWNIKRAKYLFSEVDERSELGSEELLSVSHMTGVTPRSEKNIHMFMAEDYSGSKLCQKGDLVFNIMWAWMGALGVSNYCGIVSPSYGIYRQQISNTFNSWYLEHLMRSTEYVAEYNRRSRGLHSSRLRLYADLFFDMKIGFPSIDEQNSIEQSVKKKTSLIDKAITSVEKELLVLNEYKQTLIAHAVTGKIKI